MPKDLDVEAGAVKAALDALTDEVIESGQGPDLLIHHIEGSPKNKLVVGTSSRGKSRLPQNHDSE